MAISYFSNLESYLDTDLISANSSLLNVTACAGIDSDAVITVSTVDSQKTVTANVPSDVEQFLVGNGVIDSGFNWASHFASAPDCRLRASELIKIMVYQSYYAYSTYSKTGETISGRSFNAAFYGGVKLGSFTGTGVSNFSSSKPMPSDFSPEGVYRIQAGYDGTDTLYNHGDIDRVFSVKATCIIEVNGTKYSEEEFTWYWPASTDYGVIKKIHSQAVSAENQVTARIVIQGMTAYEKVIPIPDSYSKVTGYNVNISFKDRKFSVRRHKTGFYWPWEDEFYWDEFTGYYAFDHNIRTISVFPRIIPSTVPSVQVSGLTLSVPQTALPYGTAASKPDKNDCSLTGTIQGLDMPLPYKCSPGKVVAGAIPKYKAPESVTATQLTFMDVVYGTGNTPTIVPNSPSGDWEVGTLMDVEWPGGLTSLMQTCVDLFDTVLPIEGFDAITAEQINAFYGDIVIQKDPYIALLMDNTIMQMCATQIDNMLNFIISEDGVLSSQYSTTFFQFAHLSENAEFACDAECRVSLDNVTYYPVTDPPSPLIYADGRLIAEAATDIYVDYFVLSDVSLTEAWLYAHSDDRDQNAIASDFIEKLTRARLDVVTQETLYATINGVLNSTAWLADAGKFLERQVDTVKQAMTQLIASIGTISAVTVSQKEALIAGQAYAAIPATRVAALLDTAASMGAESVNDALSILSNVTDGAYSATQISDESSRKVVDRLANLDPIYSGAIVNATQAQPDRIGADSYVSTFFERTANAIISAAGGSNNGVENEITDLGIGLRALYPALIIGNVTISDLGGNVPHDGAVVLQLHNSYVVITHGGTDMDWDIAWYAGTRGGSDLDIIQDVESSLRELATMLNVTSGGTVTMSYSDPASVTYIGQDDLVEGLSVATGALTCAAAGALIGSLGSIPGILIGAGVGAIAGAGLAMAANASQTDVTHYNEVYNLERVSNVDITLNTGTEVTSDPDVVGKCMAYSIMAALKYGAFYPYGTEKVLDPAVVSLLTPGKPYFRYVLTGDRQDWSPLVLTGAALITILNTKTCIQALGHPARTPGWLPLTLAGASASSALKLTGSAYSVIASENDPTYDMQERILKSIESKESSQSGVYTDDKGSVSLRDVSNLIGDVDLRIQELFENLSKQLVPTNSYLTY